MGEQKYICSGYLLDLWFSSLESQARFLLLFYVGPVIMKMKRVNMSRLFFLPHGSSLTSSKGVTCQRLSQKMTRKPTAGRCCIFLVLGINRFIGAWRLHPKTKKARKGNVGTGWEERKEWWIVMKRDSGRHSGRQQRREQEVNDKIWPEPM